jgi:hypothetical protein
MKNNHREGKAQSIVEFALVLPVLLLVMFLIIEFGRLLFFYAVVTTSAREAARYGGAAGDIGLGEIDKYRDCDGIRSAALRMGNLIGMQAVDSDITIRYDEGPGTSELGATCPPGGYGPELELGDRLVITTTATFEPIVPLFNMPALGVEAAARHTILVDVEMKP